jgi:hypothetical protein
MKRKELKKMRKEQINNFIEKRELKFKQEKINPKPLKFKLPKINFANIPAGDVIGVINGVGNGW